MKLLDFLTDRVAMFAAVLVGIGTVGFMFVSVAPDLWSKVVLGLLGVVIVLFSVRALAKKKRGLWWLCAFLIVFSDVSLLLTLTAAQSKEVTMGAKTDPVLIHLQDATKTAEDNLTKLIDQQANAQNRATLDALAVQITAATEAHEQAVKREDAYRPVEQSAGLDARQLFMAIPTAVVSGDLSRWMTLVFALIVALVLQMTIVATVQATVKQVKRDDAKPVKVKRRTRTKKPETVSPTAADFTPEPVEPIGMTDAL